LFGILNFDSAESFDPELTTEGLVAVCGSLVLKSIKHSVINIGSAWRIQSVHCSGQAEFHTSGAAGLKSGQFNRIKNLTA
jgi:hypothetical protein